MQKVHFGEVQIVTTEKLLDEHDIVILNTGTATRYFYNVESHIDLSPKSKDILHELPLAHKNILVENFPFWEYNEPEINLALKNVISKRWIHLKFVLSAAREFMMSWSNHLQLFTDGSKRKNKTGFKGSI